MSDSDLTRLRLQEIYRQQRRISLVLKYALYLCVPVVSFVATLLVLQNIDQAAQLQRDEIAHAVQAAPFVNGFQVYSPSTKAKDVHPPSRAFDGSNTPDSFWETSPFPIDLIVIFPEPRILAAYTISAGESADRMPKSWSVEGSLDGSAWHTLDGQEDAPSWHPGDTRSYHFKKTDPTRIIRFKFREGFDRVILRIYQIAFASVPSVPPR
jgi:hypothetical protein